MVNKHWVTTDTPYLASRAIYGVSIVRILEKIGRVLTTLHCISLSFGMSISPISLRVVSLTPDQFWPIACKKTWKWFDIPYESTGTDNKSLQKTMHISYITYVCIIHYSMDSYILLFIPVAARNRRNGCPCGVCSAVQGVVLLRPARGRRLNRYIFMYIVYPTKHAHNFCDLFCCGYILSDKWTRVTGSRTSLGAAWNGKGATACFPIGNIVQLGIMGKIDWYRTNERRSASPRHISMSVLYICDDPTLI